MTNLEITNAYVGDTQVEKIYLGADIVWGGGEPGPDYSKMPLTFNIISGGTIVWKAENSAYTTTIEYSTDNGETWTSITSTTGGTSIPVSDGDVIQFRGGYPAYSSGTSKYNSFSGSTAIFEAEGNIMSLIDSYNFATATTLTSSNTFSHLFYYCTGLTSAENLILPATTLAAKCYDYMFSKCTSLTLAPELPATTLADYCYRYMFQSCTNLTTAPELPATTLAANCYANMFNGCTSLTMAPELPATTLTQYCYSSMFRGCTGLTTAPELPATTLSNYCYQGMFNSCTGLATAPELPATTLVTSCYSNMFGGCTSLTTAPELPATTLVTSCYANMFNDCTNLNYIKCLATSGINTTNLNYWVRNVASLGTFVKYASVYWPTGTSGIPSGWDVEEIDA